MIGKDRFLFWGRIAACGHSWAGWLVTLESKRAPTECSANYSGEALYRPGKSRIRRDFRWTVRCVYKYITIQ